MSKYYMNILENSLYVSYIGVHKIISNYFNKLMEPNITYSKIDCRFQNVL